MGGKVRLERIKSLGVEAVRHTLLTEQSYRQDPFITSYERLKVKVDFVGNQIYRESHLTWPESDPGNSEIRLHRSSWTGGRSPSRFRGCSVFPCRSRLGSRRAIAWSVAPSVDSSAVFRFAFRRAGNASLHHTHYASIHVAGN
jgi:hypothetical protein